MWYLAARFGKSVSHRIDRKMKFQKINLNFVYSFFIVSQTNCQVSCIKHLTRKTHGCRKVIECVISAMAAGKWKIWRTHLPGMPQYIIIDQITTIHTITRMIGLQWGGGVNSVHPWDWVDIPEQPAEGHLLTDSFFLNLHLTLHQSPRLFHLLMDMTFWLLSSKSPSAHFTKPVHLSVQFFTLNRMYWANADKNRFDSGVDLCYLIQLHLWFSPSIHF